MRLERFGNLWIDPSYVVAVCIEPETEWNSETKSYNTTQYRVRAYFCGRSHSLGGDHVEEAGFNFSTEEQAVAEALRLVAAVNGNKIEPNIHFVSAVEACHMCHGHPELPPGDHGRYKCIPCKVHPPLSGD